MHAFKVNIKDSKTEAVAILQNSQEKNLCWSLFYKVVDLQSAALLKRDSGTGKNFAKFLRKPFT